MVKAGRPKRKPRWINATLQELPTPLCLDLIKHYQKCAIYPNTKVNEVAMGKRTSVYFDRERECFVGLTEEFLEPFKAKRPTVDYPYQIRKMIEWLLTNPKGKKKVATSKFVSDWFERATPSPYLEKQLAEEQAVATPEQLESVEDTPLRPYITEYLRELWKGREYLLEINKITL